MKECSEVKGEKPLHVCNMGKVVDLQCASYGPAVISHAFTLYGIVNVASDE